MITDRKIQTNKDIHMKLSNIRLERIMTNLRERKQLVENPNIDQIESLAILDKDKILKNDSDNDR